MTEEVTQDQSTTPEPSTTEAPKEETPSLEDVYKQFNVQPQQPPQPPQPQAKTEAPAVPPIPDPTLDPKGHEAWARERLQRELQMTGALHNLNSQLQTFRAAQQQAREEADIAQAVKVVREKVDADPDFIEIAIAQKARRDPKFMALWQGRQQNPQAWEAGLKAVAGELAGKLSMKQDPQITENLRAAKQSQQSQAVTTPEEDETTRLGKLNGAEFQRALDRYRRKA